MSRQFSFDHIPSLSSMKEITTMLTTLATATTLVFSVTTLAIVSTNMQTLGQQASVMDETEWACYEVLTQEICDML